MLNKPKPLLVYYGWPSCINGAKTIDEAANHFVRYRFVVLGDGLQNPKHPDHENTRLIIATIEKRVLPKIKPKFFGYVDLGITTQNLPLNEVELRMKAWKGMGVTGILLDDYGSEYGVDRTRQNKAVSLAHFYTMPVIANAWNPVDAFEGINALRRRDFYLSESFYIMNGKKDPFWEYKAKTVEIYQEKVGFKILSITTSDELSPFNKDLYWQALRAAQKYGHVGSGWGEYQYSAGSALAPWRPRPKVW